MRGNELMRECGVTRTKQIDLINIINNMGNAKSSLNQIPESRIITLQELYGLQRPEVLYLYDRYKAFEFEKASEKYQLEEDESKKGELATLLAQDWLFSLVMEGLRLEEGATFEKYLEAYVNWKKKSIDNKLSGKYLL